MFTARYGLNLYMTQIRFVFKRLKHIQHLNYSHNPCDDAKTHNLIPNSMWLYSWQYQEIRTSKTQKIFWIWIFRLSAKNIYALSTQMKPSLPTGLPWIRIKHFYLNSNHVIFAIFRKQKCMYYSNMEKSLLCTQTHLYHRTGIQHTSKKPRKMFRIRMAKTGKRSRNVQAEAYNIQGTLHQDNLIFQ